MGLPPVAECITNCWTTAVTAITLPDNTSYSFEYDCDSTTGIAACNASGGQSGYYGTLTQMTLPTGEQINYGYSMFGGVSWLNNQNEFPSWWVTSKTSNQGTWTYTPLATAGAGSGNTCLPGYYGIGCMQTTVQRPDGSKEVTSFIVSPVLGGPWPQQVLSYNTDGATLLSTVVNTWDFSHQSLMRSCYAACYENVLKLSTTTTVPIPGGNLTKQTTYAYDSPQTGNPTAIKEWKYQSGTSPTFPSVPDRATYMTYATIGTNNDIDRPTKITVCNNTGTDSNCPGGGSTVAQATVTYDNYGSASGNCLQRLSLVTGVVNHDDTNYACSNTARGNPTQISQWVSSGASLTTSFTYDTTGQVTTSTDSAGNVTNHYYAPDNFYNDNGSDPASAYTPAQPTNAYVVKVTDNIGTASAGYYYGSGKVALSTDYDGATTYSHYMDAFDRPTDTDYPIGWVLNQYHTPVSGQTEVDSYAPVGYTGSASASCSNCTHSQSILDALGRVTTHSLVNNPVGQVYVNYAYDAVNRVISASHPNFGSSDPNDVVETQGYDGLSRQVIVTHPDGQSGHSTYGAAVTNAGGLMYQSGSSSTYGFGFPALSIDEANNPRQEWIDGFGHVIEVDEPTSTVAATQATGTINISGVANCTQQSVTVGSYTSNMSLPCSAQPSSVASAIGRALNGSRLVRTSVFGTTVNVTSIVTGPSRDYPLSMSGFTGSVSGLSGGAAATWNWQVTNCTYDALGNLTGIVQGAQTRAWTYDGLSRLTKEITPEAGTVTLSYLNVGSPCSGNPSNPCSRTAPAPNQTGTTTVTTTYSYDNANRLKQKTYSDNSATVTYTYQTTAYGIGLLATMTDPSGSETCTYDLMKRVTMIAKKIGSTTYTTQYAYNTAGQLTQITYPSGRVVYYNYDVVGHLCQVATSAAANGSCNAATTYLTLPSVQYDAAGRPLSATYGNGVTATVTYAPNTFELASLKYTKGSTTYLGLNYYYQKDSTNCPTGNAIGNNGQIQCIADVSSGTGDSGRSVAYTYDQLGRLLTAATTGSTQYPAWGLSETYDRYANRTAQTVTAGSGYGGTWSINAANNQITSFSYDAVGNVISVPSPTTTYAYDHEECNTGYAGNGSNATYTCDGNELRVQKVVTGTDAVNTIYVRSAGQVLAEYDNGAAVASPTREFLYGNNLLATVTGSTGGPGGTIVYQHRDHLSPRIYTDANGNCVGDQGSYPFGELWYQNNDTGCSNTTSSSFLFTTYERDVESGNDYALARSYASTQGRFLSPDPLEGIVGDPQSWNRYAYVENDPINLSDPSGQGFWFDLGLAIANLFVDFFCQACIPAMTAVDEAAAETTAEEIAKAVFVATRIVMISCAVVETGEPCGTGGSGGAGSGGNSGTTNSAPGATGSSGGSNPGGGPGAGTTDPGNTGASGQGPGGASTGGGGAGSGGDLPSTGGAWKEGGAVVGGNIWGKVDIWNVCGKCWSALGWFGNFSSGAAHFLTFGYSTKFNRWTGAESVVNEHSGAYTAGFVTGIGITAAGGALAAGKVFAGLDTQIAIHGAHHPFWLIGKVPHLQIMWNVSRAAMAGGLLAARSGQAIRIPLTPWWP
jgi:RHS repeat-associated protein